MMHRLEKYSSYKDSGVEWLGEIPEHWESLANKYIFTLKKELVGKRSSEYDLLSLTLRGIIKRDMENPEGKFPAEFDTYQEVKENDFVFCLFDVEETPRTIGLSKYNGMITGAYTVMQAINMDRDYLYYFYLNLDEKKRMRPLYTGLRNTISKDNFFAFKTFVPPKEEQTKIANYLDTKTAQIDEVIKQKEELISLLKERRQVLIHKAVTQGLDATVRMKDSGVEWLGEVPEHWKIVKNRVLFSERNEAGNENLPILMVSIHTAVSSEEIDDGTNIRGKIRIEDKTSYKLVEPTDIVFNMMRAWQGAIGAVRVKGMVSPAYVVGRSNKQINANFFEYQYRTDSFIQQMDRFSKGITDFRKRLYWSEFKQLNTILPPLSEQHDIVVYIKLNSDKIDNAISFQDKQIDKLKEYKATLIDSLVTGKKRVCDE